MGNIAILYIGNVLFGIILDVSVNDYHTKVSRTLVGKHCFQILYLDNAVFFFTYTRNSDLPLKPSYHGKKFF